MIKKLLLTVVLSFVLPIIYSEAFAGSESHGGSSIVCRSRRGAVISVELTDSYEQGDFRLLPPETDEIDVYYSALNRLSFRPDVQLWLKEALAAFQSRVKASEGPLPWVGDLGRARRLLPGCEYQQLAVFDGSQILVNPELYKALSSRDRAALIIHEAIYYIARDFKGAEINNSMWARAVTGELISQSNVEDSDGVLQSELRQIAFHMVPGIYRLGECRLHLSFEDDFAGIRIYTRKVDLCAAYGITRNELLLQLDWKTGEYFSSTGEHLVPGSTGFTLGASAFVQKGFFFWPNMPIDPSSVPPTVPTSVVTSPVPPVQSLF